VRELRRELAESQAKREQAEAQVAVLASALEPLAKVWDFMREVVPPNAKLEEWGLWSRNSNRAEDCYLLHCGHARDARETIATLPSLATAHIEQDRAMRAALVLARRYVGMPAHSHEVLDAISEALREEVKQGDKTGL